MQDITKDIRTALQLRDALTYLIDKGVGNYSVMIDDAMYDFLELRVDDDKEHINDIHVPLVEIVGYPSEGN